MNMVNQFDYLIYLKLQLEEAERVVRELKKQIHKEAENVVTDEK